ncbi:unnamed protein product [Mesocestoides corti]|uniref:Cysteine and histidine-rich domain-containing protein n=2 Tax=Mesocestoides corti TaxID=53468 RepID=A0A0R3U8W5_MESCO|nr:unnamed protein product [Mesocestoides corti]
MPMVRCYNKGCGKEFNSEENESNACQYHPGEPIFHDAKKKWSCCKKYSTDFGEFLSIKGCTVGRHNPEKPKPAVVEKPVAEVKIAPPPQPAPKPAPKIPLERPSADAPLTVLTPVVSTSLKKSLELLKTKCAPSSDASGDKGFTTCCNSGCKATYSGPDSNNETCMYHPGAPVFHEGCKYWSCCQRKTTEFESFLAQEGCTSGRHAWTKEAAASSNLVASPATSQCNFDWFQMPETVTLSVYAKNTLPESTDIRCNAVFLTISLLYDGGRSRFERPFNLYGIIDPEKSRVNLMGTKVEVVMRKAEACSWPTLELKPPKPATTEVEEDEEVGPKATVNAN